MADALTGLTEVSATVEEIVSTTVQEVLTAAMVVVPTISDFSSQVGPGMDTLKIPRFGNFTVNDKAENTAEDAQVNAFSTDDLALDKHQVVQFLVEDIADIQAKVNVTSSYLTQAAKDLAAKMDDEVITDMESNVSAAAPDHIIDFDNTPTDTLSRGDILAARRLLNVQNVAQSDRFALISPLRESELLAIEGFVEADKYGSSEPLVNGELGRIYGFRFVMSSQADDDATLLYHRTSEAFARQLNPRTQQDMDLPNLAQRWSIDHIYGFKTLDSGKRIVRIKDGGA